MVDSLPKLFGRRFIVAHLFPVAAFAVSVVGTFWGFDPLVQLAKETTSSAPSLVAALILLWSSGLLLETLNHPITRAVEGYPRLNPLRALGFIEKWRYRRLHRRIESVENALAGAARLGAEQKRLLVRERSLLHHRAATRFPDAEEWLLPTSFGNAMRAFEVYPRLLYGLEAIDGWFRLVTLLPERLADQLDEGKARVDFWLNICWLSGVMLILTVAFGDRKTTDWIGSAVAAGLVATFSYFRAVHAAVHWGNWVKAAFDLYRSDLAARLGATASMGIDETRMFFNLQSRALRYRASQRLNDLEQELPTWRAVVVDKESSSGGLQREAQADQRRSGGAAVSAPVDDGSTKTHPIGGAPSEAHRPDSVREGATTTDEERITTEEQFWNGPKLFALGIGVLTVSIISIYRLASC